MYVQACIKGQITICNSIVTILNRRKEKTQWTPLLFVNISHRDRCTMHDVNQMMHNKQHCTYLGVITEEVYLQGTVAEQDNNGASGPEPRA